jgi:hypothetical protein
MMHRHACSAIGAFRSTHACRMRLCNRSMARSPSLCAPSLLFAGCPCAIELTHPSSPLLPPRRRHMLNDPTMSLRAILQTSPSPSRRSPPPTRPPRPSPPVSPSPPPLLSPSPPAPPPPVPFSDTGIYLDRLTFDEQILSFLLVATTPTPLISSACEQSIDKIEINTCEQANRPAISQPANPGPPPNQCPLTLTHMRHAFSS